MSDELHNLKERIKRKFVAEYVDNFKKPEHYAVTEDGKFSFNLRLTNDQMLFILMHFDSQEEFKDIFFDEITRRTEDKM